MTGARWLGQLGAVARRHPAGIGVALVLVAGLGVWIYAGVRGALLELATTSLRSLVAAEVVALETWIGEKRLNVQRWALDPRVVDSSSRLLASAARGDAALKAACNAGEGRRLVEHVDTLRREDAAAAVHLIDRSGRVLAARDPARCGLQLDAVHFAAFAAVFNGGAEFAATQLEADRIGTGRPGEGPKVWISAPVRDAAGKVLAVLDIGKPADDRFSQLFASAAIGETGEAFAFDARGLLLSESRFRRSLVESGALRAGESGILRIRLLDTDDDTGEARPTRLVLKALAALREEPPRDSGELLSAYSTYYGERVVGAWRWLQPYGFGVAVEVAESEVFAPLKRVEWAFFVLAAMVGSAAFGFVVALLRIQRMAQEVEEARRVGNYELLEEIGQGGMARVYRARHRLLKRPTAVKIIELGIANDEMLARFQREVRLVSQLQHPNTVEVFDYGSTPEGQPFYAMEYLDGLNLQQIVDAHGPLPPARVAHTLRGIAGSLAEAHGRGLIHRDVKPMNVMLCRRGGADDVVKVLDFGLVKDTRTEQTRDLTRALRVLGTPSYMAPERIEKPDNADFRTDLYSLGAVGFYLLAGRAPFEGDNDLALAYKVVNAPAPALGPEVPAPLAALIARCLAKSAAARPPSAQAVIDELDALLRAQPWTATDASDWWHAHGTAAQRNQEPASASA